ncbi:helix-turn-helix transcriptional regulator [Clostridium sp. HBUAS56010]|uniref:helix-turn-helix domain-containing protein n=1 Tax=Clostridium sp. HBUAS56010 TaxID=2571127 RepID=UPI00117827BD|nr:helix-turn-helix transcriptional regulator [Clostridium sp. HBUAS56010]
MYEIFEKLLLRYGVTAYKVAKATGISQTTLSDWKRGRSTPKSDNMRKIADYFGITLDYLMSGVESKDEKETNLMPMYERDIAKRFSEIIEDMSNKDSGPLYFKGEKLDDKSLAILTQALKSAMKQVEIIRK